MEAIQIKLIQIGNSKGIRIPKHVLTQLNMTDDLELLVDDEHGQINIKPVKKVREGWAEAFKKMHERGEDELIIPDSLDLDFDIENWEW